MAAKGKERHLRKLFFLENVSNSADIAILVFFCRGHPRTIFIFNSKRKLYIYFAILKVADNRGRFADIYFFPFLYITFLKANLFAMHNQSTTVEAEHVKNQRKSFLDFSKINSSCKFRKFPKLFLGATYKLTYNFIIK